MEKMSLKNELGQNKKLFLELSDCEVSDAINTIGEMLSK